MISLVPFLLGVGAASQPVPSHLVVENCQIAEMYAFNTAECDVALANEGDTPIRIFDAKAVNSEDAVSPMDAVIPPHSTTYLKFRISSGNGTGNVRHWLRFRSDEGDHEDRTAAAFAFVMNVLDDPRLELDLGVVDAAGTPTRKSMDIVSHDAPDLRILKILELPDWLEATVSTDGRSIVANVKPGANWGVHAGFVKLAINTLQQGQAWISVKADVHGDVVPASNPYDMSLLRIGSENEFRIPLRSRSRKSFDVGKLELEGIRGSVHLDQCEMGGGDCRMLILKVTEQQPGALVGHVWIDLPEFHQRLNLAVWGLLVPKDMQIKSFEPKAAAENVASMESRSAKPLDLQRAVSNAVKSNTEAPPPGSGPLLKWTIANGTNIHGFQIFRGSQENGPFVLLNPASVPAAQTDDSVNYQWRDTSAKSGDTYWYYIGMVYNDGHKQQLTGPHKVVAK